MSMPKFPINPNDMTREDAVNMIVSSIAMEELGLSHILNAEGEKLQYVLGTLTGSSGLNPTIDELLMVNESVQKTLATSMQNQMFLQNKMSSALNSATLQGPTGPTGLPGPALAAETALFTIGISGLGKTGSLTEKSFVFGEGLYIESDTLRVSMYENSTHIKIEADEGLFSGVTGPTGAIGPTGNDGPAGAKGDTGPAGNDGAAGTKGDTGPAGIDGAKGDMGAKGATGPQGVSGIQGVDGKQGPSGPQGEQGVAGATGQAGSVGTIVGHFDTVTELETGVSVGTAGAFYYVAPDLYAYDTIKNEWYDVGQIQGPQGIAGIQGVQGERGDAGPSGPQGIQGIQGVQGEIGPTGPMGAAGKDGLTGQAITGPTGSQGVQGIQGITGPTGVTGPIGNTGAKGDRGDTGPIGPTPVFPVPTNISLPPAVNMQNRNEAFYYKNAFGEVHVWGRLYSLNSTMKYADVIATLPAGYRPSIVIVSPASIIGVEYGDSSGGCTTVSPNGAIQVWMSQAKDTWSFVMFDATFVAQ